MKRSIASLFFFSLACCLTLFAADDLVVDNATGLSFPRTVTFDSGGKNYKLQATGVATRKKFFVKVYSIAHYIQDATALSGNDKIAAVLNSPKAKQLTLKFDRSIDGQKVQDGYRESFSKGLSAADQSKLKSQIDTFIALFKGGVEKGDEEILRWLPDGNVEVMLKGKLVGTISGKEFARGLWEIWFGEHSVVDRDKLVSLLQ